jgi:hypothetical protein
VIPPELNAKKSPWRMNPSVNVSSTREMTYIGGRSGD